MIWVTYKGKEKEISTKKDKIILNVKQFNDIAHQH